MRPVLPTPVPSIWPDWSVLGGLGLGLGLPLDRLVPHQLVVAVGCQPALRGCARECWRLHLGKDPSVGTWDKKGKGDRRSDGRENAGCARMLKEMATSTR